MRKGNSLHNEWDKQLEQVRSYSKHIRLSLWLLAAALSFFIVKYFFIKPIV